MTSEGRYRRSLRPQNGIATVSAPAWLAMWLENSPSSRVLLAEQAPLLICRTLGSFARQLPEPPFARLGRSLIVNAERLRSVEAAGRSGTLVSLAGTAEPLRLGETAARRLRLLQARLGR